MRRPEGCFHASLFWCRSDAQGIGKFIEAGWRHATAGLSGLLLIAENQTCASASPFLLAQIRDIAIGRKPEASDSQQSPASSSRLLTDTMLYRAPLQARASKQFVP
ncbi:MAG TPA: hypothetical protein VFX06_09145 [Stellaceae bacterium]|nr:hypothetical protein [Stellaceae bacterium]